MKLKSILTLALALPTLALAAPQRYEMKSYVSTGGEVQPAFAWCDAPGRVLAVTQPAKPLINPQPASLMTWLKGVKGNPNIDTVQLGPSDAGAGNIYTALTPPGVAVPNTPTSYIHTSNVENVNDPAYRMTHVNEFRLDGKSYRCRYVPQAAFMGVTSKRTVIVWENGKTATYATRNFDGTPSVFLREGRAGYRSFAQRAGHPSAFQSAYFWQTPDGYTYQLEFADWGARVTVQKNGKIIQVEPFLAYSVSLPVGQK